MIWLKSTKVDQRHLDRARFSNDLYRLARSAGKDRPQRLVSPHHFIERPPQDCDIQLSAQTHRRRKVVGRIARFHLIEKPLPLLRKRQRQPSVALYPPQRRHCSPPLLSQPRLDGSRQLFDSRMLENFPHGQLNREGLFEPRDQSRRQQRVPSQLEEVALCSHLLSSEHLTVGSRHDL